MEPTPPMPPILPALALLVAIICASDGRILAWAMVTCFAAVCCRNMPADHSLSLIVAFTIEFFFFRFIFRFVVRWREKRQQVAEEQAAEEVRKQKLALEGLTVVVNGVQHVITNQQLYDWAARGIIGPGTMVYRKGQQFLASQAKGIVFGVPQK